MRVRTNIVAGANGCYPGFRKRLSKSTSQPCTARIQHHMNSNILPGERLEYRRDCVNLSIAKGRCDLHLLGHALLLLFQTLRELGGLLLLRGKLSFYFLFLALMLGEFNLQLQIGPFGVFGFMIRGCGIRERLIRVSVGLSNIGVSGDFVGSQIYIF